MVDLHELVRPAVPHRQPLDLHHRIDVVVRAATVLRARMGNEREGVLMVDRQRRAGQFHPWAREHAFDRGEILQMRIVNRNAVVLGAWPNSMCSASRLSTRPRWLEVLSPEGLEWLWKSALIQPLVLNRSLETRRERRFLATFHGDRSEDGVEFRAVARR